jgi:hypothetical protein
MKNYENIKLKSPILKTSRQEENANEQQSANFMMLHKNRN